MISVNDVVQRIAKDIRGYSNQHDEIGLEEFLVGSTFSFHISITTDVEESEKYYLEQVGKGRSYYFPLQDYQHGRRLAAELYWLFVGKVPDMKQYTGAGFTPDDKLILFVYVSDVSPASSVATNVFVSRGAPLI